VRGIQKHHTNHKHFFAPRKKSMSEKNPGKIDKNFDVRFSSTFVVLSRFWVFLSDGSSKILKKKRGLQKNRVENLLPKNRKKIKTDFILFRFLVRGDQKQGC
jgi:hypothetical protein